MARSGQTGGLGTGGGRGAWVILLLLLAGVLAPTACVLWFMSAAIRNERSVVRQQLTDAYRSQLVAAGREAADRWRQRAQKLSAAEPEVSPARRFAVLVREGVCDAAVLHDAAGNVLYPPREAASSAPAPVEMPAEWAMATNLEYARRRPAEAAVIYARIADGAEDPATVARAAQAQARCLARAGRTDQAIEVLAEVASRPDLRNARDAQGRLIGPNGLLMALELMGGAAHERYQATLQALASCLNDYSEPVMPPTQRVFLMRRLQEEAPDAPELPTLAAEELAAQYVAASHPPPLLAGLSPAGLDGVWRLPAADRTAVGLFREEHVIQEMRQTAERGIPGSKVEVEVVPPDREEPQREPFITAAVGGHLPGWRLALYLEGPDPFSEASSRQITAYFWTASIVLLFTGVVVSLVGRYLLRQVRLTRLKNDFIATVSHELKTPLSSVRMLVDTLLEGNYRDTQQAHEYLELVSKENERLSRLIDNFLSFSRMERDKRAFEFEDVAPGRIVETAAGLVRDRFQAQGCRFDVEVAPDLPSLKADRDALVTVVLNLLDNAFKYSQNDRQIALRAYQADGAVCLEVADNGVGMSRRAVRKVFDPFYQADRSLSRSVGGCGLGLSIVKFIVDAHGGSIDVQSRPGEGSTFTVKLPRRAASAQP